MLCSTSFEGPDPIFRGDRVGVGARITVSVPVSYFRSGLGDLQVSSSLVSIRLNEDLDVSDKLLEPDLAAEDTLELQEPVRTVAAGTTFLGRCTPTPGRTNVAGSLWDAV